MEYEVINCYRDNIIDHLDLQDNVKGDMMLFIEYEKCKRKYEHAGEIYEMVLQEQEELFTKTQPNAIRYDKDKVLSSVSGDNLENYMIERERKLIDKRLADARELLEVRKGLMDLKEKDLRLSPDTIDIVYVCKFIDGMHTKDICDRLSYGKSHIYRLIEKIESQI